MWAFNRLCRAFSHSDAKENVSVCLNTHTQRRDTQSVWAFNRLCRAFFHSDAKENVSMCFKHTHTEKRERECGRLIGFVEHFSILTRKRM